MPFTGVPVTAAPDLTITNLLVPLPLLQPSVAEVPVTTVALTTLAPVVGVLQTVVAMPVLLTVDAR